MALSNYAELQTAVGNLLRRGDLADAIPDFITMAEAQFNREISHWRMEKRATATIDAQFSAVPDDLLRPLRFHVGGSKCPLELTTADEMQDMRGRVSDTAGEPRFYAMVGGEFEFFPTPDESYTGTLTYLQTIPALSDSNTTNWLLQFAPDAYLYGAAQHAAPYLQEDERLMTWGSLYRTAVQGLMQSDNDGRFGAPMRMNFK